jgi:hypothetical protein
VRGIGELSNAEKIIYARNGPAEATRERRLLAAKSWLEHCAANHELCNEKSAVVPPFPTRILLIGDEKLTLVVGDDAERDRFAALSHCWGGSQPLRTLEANIKSHQEQGIAISDLPATFRDAIHACKFLGYRYIWIDSLCIVQDDRSDWEREAGRMAGVYANAHVVIGGSSSGSSSETFLDKGAGFFRGGVFLDPKTKANGVYYSPDLHSYGGAYTPEPLETRGWTFQERQLASRFLTFGTTEALWDCKTEYACECRGARMLEGKALETGDISFDDRILLEGDKTRFYKYWRENFVPHYMSRHFTFPEDRLVALAAVAETYQGLVGDTYVAGLWKSEIKRDLLWQPTKHSTSYKKPYGDASSEKPAPGIPSWSWASANMPVDYELFSNYNHSWSSKGPSFWAEFIAAGPAPAAGAPNPLGDFRGSWIELQGLTRRVRWPLEGADKTLVQRMNFDFEPAAADIVLPDGTAARTLTRPDSKTSEVLAGAGSSTGAAATQKCKETAMAIEGDFWFLGLLTADSTDTESTDIRLLCLIAGVNPENTANFVRLGLGEVKFAAKIWVKKTVRIN